MTVNKNYGFTPLQKKKKIPNKWYALAASFCPVPICSLFHWSLGYLWVVFWLCVKFCSSSLFWIRCDLSPTSLAICLLNVFVNLLSPYPASKFWSALGFSLIFIFFSVYSFCFGNLISFNAKITIILRIILIIPNILNAHYVSGIVYCPHFQERKLKSREAKWLQVVRGTAKIKTEAIW